MSAPEIRDIEAFIAVAEAGGVSGAARRLGLAKSVVSKRVTALERSLGATLLLRAARAVTLTDRGRAYYERARVILSSLDEAAGEVRDLQQSLSGLIRIAAPVSFGTLYLGDLMWPFLRAHPQLEVALDLDDRIVDLLGSGYDLGIRIGSMPDSSLIARVLADIPLVVCASPDYLARAGDSRIIGRPACSCVHRVRPPGGGPGLAFRRGSRRWRAGRSGAEPVCGQQCRVDARRCCCRIGPVDGSRVHRRGAAASR